MKGRLCALVAVAAAAVLFTGGGSSEAEVVKGGCRTVASRFATSTDTAFTTSTTFVDVPDMSVTVQSRRGCIMVSFSAYPYYDGYPGAVEIVYVRALLDGTVVANPALDVVFDMTVQGYSGYTGARTFNFAFADVSPGPHTVSIQWKTYSGGLVGANLFGRSLLVHY